MAWWRYVLIGALGVAGGVILGVATAPEPSAEPAAEVALTEADLAAVVAEQTGFEDEVVDCIARRAFEELDADDLRDLVDGGPEALSGSPIGQRYVWLLVGCQR
jgi:hypothetical protein